jgi:hypothetical protein
MFLKTIPFGSYRHMLQSVMATFMGHEVDASADPEIKVHLPSRKVTGTLYIDGVHWDQVRGQTIGVYWGPVDGMQVPQTVELLIVSSQLKIGMVVFEVAGTLTQ